MMTVSVLVARRLTHQKRLGLGVSSLSFDGILFISFPAYSLQGDCDQNVVSYKDTTCALEN